MDLEMGRKMVLESLELLDQPLMQAYISGRSLLSVLVTLYRKPGFHLPSIRSSIVVLKCTHKCDGAVVSQGGHGSFRPDTCFFGPIPCSLRLLCTL